MEGPRMIEKDADYRSTCFASAQDGTLLSFNYNHINEKEFNNDINASLENANNLEILDELDIKEEPIEYNDVTSQFLDAQQMLQKTYENEILPINDYIQVKTEKYIKFQKDSRKPERSFSNILENLNESNINQHIENNGSEYNSDPLRLSQNISKSIKPQCIIPLKNLFTQFSKGNEGGQRSEFRELQTTIHPVKSEPLDCHSCGEKFTDISVLQNHLNKHLIDMHNAENCELEKYLFETKNKHISGNSKLNPVIPDTENNKGNRENLIAQAVNSVLSALNLPAANVLSKLKTSDKGSALEPLNDPLRINYDLDVYNYSQNLNKKPSRICKISAKKRITDSLIEECDLFQNKKNLKRNKIKQSNVLSKLKTSDRCENVRETVNDAQKQTESNRPQNQVLKTQDEARYSKKSDIEDFITFSELNKYGSYKQPESRKQLKQVLRAKSNDENSTKLELNESKTSSMLYTGCSIEPLNDPLRINYNLDVFNSSQNLNQTPSTSFKISAKKHISDPLIEECNSLKNTKNVTMNQLKQYGWNWETNINNYERHETSHSPRDNYDKNDDQESKIKNISEEDVSILKINNGNSNFEESVSIENNIENDFRETISIKHKVKRKRLKWKAGEDGMYACKLCSYKAKKAPYLKRHMITHVIDKPHKCHICDKSFCHYNSLRMHLDMHNGVRRYQCTLCDYSFIQKVHLKTHMLSHTRERRYQCEICEKKFSRRDHLRSHVLTHSDERPFPCDECELAFKNKSNLFHHKRNHANDRRYKCQHCDASFMLSNTLRHHLASHLVYRKGYKVCPECPLFFWSPSQFVSHLTKQHEYSTEEGEQLLKITISETNFRFYRNKKKKIADKELGENVKPAFNNQNNDNEIGVKIERDENEEYWSSIKINSLAAVETHKHLDGSEDRVNEAGTEVNEAGGEVALDLLSNMDLNQPVVTCTSRQVLRSSADSQFLVISYKTNQDDEIKKTEYFKLVKEDQGGLTIQDLQRRFISYHDIETKIMTGDEN